MPKKAKPETAAEVKPTMVPVEIKSETYELCFDVPELVKAERHFRSQGVTVNLMFSLPELTLSGIRDSFPFLVHTSRPALTFSQAQDLVDVVLAYPIALAISQAFDSADAKKA